MAARARNSSERGNFTANAIELKSKRVHAPFAAVLRIADQPLPFGIDDPVECLQRDLSDQDRVLIELKAGPIVAENVRGLVIRP